MYRAIVLVVLLSISPIRAGLLKVGENIEPGSTFVTSGLCNKGTTCHSSSISGHSEANKNTLVQTKNVFGKDNRIPVESTDYPWRAIGKLSMGCTGALVGRDLVLTAAHCVIDQDTYSLIKSPIFFYSNMINNVSNHQAWVSYAWWGTDKPDTYREADWALLRLDKKLGDTQGWFATRTVSIDILTNMTGTLVGYSLDFRNGETAGAHSKCRIIKQSTSNFFLHDCNMSRGASGGPIFEYLDGQPTIYALNVAEYRNGGDTSLQLLQYTDENANIAIWSSELPNKINELSAA